MLVQPLIQFLANKISKHPAILPKGGCSCRPKGGNVKASLTLHIFYEIKYRLIIKSLIISNKFF